MRELVRLREDLKDDRRRAQQRLKSMLLRHGKRPPTRTRGWSQAYERWVRSQRFSEPAAAMAFAHVLATLDPRMAELTSLDRELELVATAPPLSGPVARLRCFRGIDTLSAITVAAEVCDFHRFGGAPSFMAFTGLVPSEHSSGASERRGPITKAGNSHVRRVLVEAAWSYRHHPAVGAKLRRRIEGQPPEVVAYAWRAQLRLCTRFRSLSNTKQQSVVATAVARELSGFVWA